MASGLEQVSIIAVSYIRRYFRMDCAILLTEDLDHLDEKIRNETSIQLSENEFSIASWVYKHSNKAGKYTDTLPSTNFTFYPLTGAKNNMGVIVVESSRIFTQGEEQFWDACLSQISGKYEREYLRNAARNAYILSESDKLYKTLFNSISHELRIPVATIIGCSDLLLSQNYPEETRKKLYGEINTASVRLNRLIENLLNMSRLESGRITPHPDWIDVQDLANKVADSLNQELLPFNFSVVIPENMPLVQIDFGLMEQVLYNLILNATQYAPSGTNIRLKFYFEHDVLTIQVMDRGKGFPREELPSVFNKFYRGQEARAGGTGLGLSIVKGFVEAQGGTVKAENRQNGGALFTIKVPVKVVESIAVENK
jgi:two-component system sensor histidine kinase KdpD